MDTAAKGQIEKDAFAGPLDEALFTSSKKTLFRQNRQPETPAREQLADRRERQLLRSGG